MWCELILVHRLHYLIRWMWWCCCIVAMWLCCVDVVWWISCSTPRSTAHCRATRARATPMTMARIRRNTAIMTAGTTMTTTTSGGRSMTTTTSDAQRLPHRHIAAMHCRRRRRRAARPTTRRRPAAQLDSIDDDQRDAKSITLPHNIAHISFIILLLIESLKSTPHTPISYTTQYKQQYTTNTPTHHNTSARLSPNQLAI
jgi:hypothetical protein